MAILQTPPGNAQLASQYQATQKAYQSPANQAALRQKQGYAAGTDLGRNPAAGSSRNQAMSGSPAQQGALNGMTSGSSTNQGFAANPQQGALAGMGGGFASPGQNALNGMGGSMTGGFGQPGAPSPIHEDQNTAILNILARMGAGRGMAQFGGQDLQQPAAPQPVPFGAYLRAIGLL